MSAVLTVAAFMLAGAVAGVGGAVLTRRFPTSVLRVPPLACALMVAALWGWVGWCAPRLPVCWWPIPLLLAWAGVLLGIIDVRSLRLPDAMTLPAYPVAVLLAGIAAAGAADVEPLIRALGGALLWAGGYAAVRLIAPDSLGGGDVKLAGSLGALTAAASWPGLLLAILAATALTVLIAGPVRLLGHREVPHGPAMLVAAWLVVLHPSM